MTETPTPTITHLDPAAEPPAGLIDAQAAAELLGVPKTWVLAQARAQRIPHLRLGRYVRFEPAELRRWWAAQRRGPGKAPWSG